MYEDDAKPTGYPRESVMPLHPEYARLFSALTDKEIPFCLLRPSDNLMRLQGDLDLLVSPGHVRASLQVFESLGYQVIRTGRKNPGKVVVVRWDGQHAIYLDIHYSVVIQGFEYLDAARVLANSVRRGGVAFPSDPDLALILLIHDAVGKHHVQPKYHAVLRSLWPMVAGSAALSDASERGFCHLLPLTTAELEALFNDSAAIMFGKRFRRAMRWHPATVANRLRIRFQSVLPHRPRGIVIALLGPDGSGKTSTIQCLHGLLQTEMRWPTSVLYMGPWGHDLFSLTSRTRFPPPDSWREMVTRRCRRLAANEGASTVGEVLGIEIRRRFATLTEAQMKRRWILRDVAPAWMVFRWLRGHVRYVLGLVVLSLELCWRYIRVMRLRRQGQVVICDRYVYDLLTGEMHAINRRYEWARRLICRLIPPPDVSILLWNGLEQLHCRKQQLSRENLAAFLEFYDELAKEHGFEKVRTDVPPVAVACRIIDRVFPRVVESLRF